MNQPVIDQIGGETMVRTLVERFYDIIETRVEGKSILALHQDGHGLLHARAEQFNFLCGFLGGKNYYLDKHHHMSVKKMHEHVAIRIEDAEAWLVCMDMAIENCGISGSALPRFRETFKRVAMSLVNQND